MHQRILANNHVALAEAARDRAEAEATQQAHVEWDLRHQLAHTQNVVVDLQHEVHYLNNQLHLILDEEEDGPDMLVENDGWEEEVEPVDEDDVISDLDSENADKQSSFNDQLDALDVILCYHVMDMWFKFQFHDVTLL